MDSSPVLRHHSKNKIDSDHNRMKNEHKKIPADPKHSKYLSVPHLSKRNIENHDPGCLQNSQKPPVKPSRLPVLAKSLQFKTSMDFVQSHKKWEEKLQAGKAKKKKPCTRPEPFNLSQPRSARTASRNQKPSTSASSKIGAQTTQHEKILHSVNPKIKTINTKLSSAVTNSNHSELAIDLPVQLSTAQYLVTRKGSLPVISQSNEDLTQITEKPQGNQPSSTASVMSHLPKQISAAAKTLHGPTKSVHFSPDPAALISILQNEMVKADGALGAITCNSVCPAVRGSSIYMAQRVPASKSCARRIARPGETPVKWTPQRVPVTRTQPMSSLTSTHQESLLASALRMPYIANSMQMVPEGGNTDLLPPKEAIVQRLFDELSTNEMAKDTGTQAKQIIDHISTSQQVSVNKSQLKDGPATESLYFSPNPTALRSILQNEGVKAEGALGTTSRSSVFSSGRGTSIYTARRVPVSKSSAEMITGPVAVPVKENPVKWTPQRVPVTRNQPLLSVARAHRNPLASAHRTPYTDSFQQRASKGSYTDLLLPKEEIVQRLFDDQEDESSEIQTEKNAGTQAKSIMDHTSINVSHSGQKEEINGSREEVGEVNRKGEEEEQEQKNIGSQLFFQAPHRESVILFSTGKKLFKVPCFETVENSVQQEQRSTVLAAQRMEQHGTVLAAQRLQLPINEEYPSGSEPAWQDNPSILSLPRDFFVPKNCAHSPAMALLRKRLPPVEELRLDAEVATYASRPAPAPPTLQPPRPRCGNPLAFILHFQESTTFVPIDCDPSSGPASPSASALPDNICTMGSFS